MGLGRCLCAATTQSCSGTEAAGQGESWWRGASASPLPCAPSLEAQNAIANTATAQVSAVSGGDSPVGSVHPSAPPLPTADDDGSDHADMWTVPPFLHGPQGGIGDSVTLSRGTGRSDGVPVEEGQRHSVSQAAPVEARDSMTGPESSGFNTEQIVSVTLPDGFNTSSPILAADQSHSLTEKGLVSTAVHAKNLEIKVDELEGTKKGLELELRALRLEVQKNQVHRIDEEQRDPMVHDLKQQLERAEAARAQAEIHLAELRRTQKAVGQPTECVTLQGRRFTAEEVFSELEMRSKQIEELEAKAAVHASELTHAHLERDWAKDEQRRAEEALAQSKTRKVNGQNYTHEEACWELERTLSQVKVLVATNEAYSAAERSENDVWQIALKDMSAQLQVTSSERAACQTAMLRLQDSLGEQTRVHAEAVKELQSQVETIDAERTCIELELTQVKAERDTLTKKLAASQTTCKELSDQWEKLAGTGKTATVMDSQAQPQDLTQRLKCAENQVERLSSCLANEQIARDLVTKQLVTATNEKKTLEQKVKALEKERSRLHSELGSTQSRNITSSRHKDHSNTATPRASVQRDAELDKESTALKVPPNKVPDAGSPDVAALLVPFRDRLLAFEAKHRKAGTAASQAGTACCTPQQKEERQRGAAEALVRALQVSREAYADALRAQQEDNGDHGAALGDVGNVFRNKGRSRSAASLQSLGQRSAADQGGQAPAGSQREESIAGGKGKGRERSRAGSEHDSVSEELARLIKETEQQKESEAADAATLGSNATRMNEYLQKLKKDLDDCLKDSDSVDDDAPHSVRSSSTGILSEAPMVRHEKAKQRNQRMAEKHKHIIESIQGVITLVVASAKLKADHTHQKESVQNPETADARKMSASANNYDVFCMLEDALDPSLAGGQSLRASLAPSHVSSTQGPFKMNSWKMQTESKPLIDLNMSRESGAAGRSMNRAHTFSAASVKKHPSLPVLNALSLPIDRDKAQSGQGRSERFTLEEVREEHTESFKSLYPRKAGNPGKVTTPVATTPPAVEKPSTAPRRWSMLRMFTTGKKSEASPSPGVTANRSAGGNPSAHPPYNQATDSGHTIMHGHQPQPSAPMYPQRDSMRSGSNLHEPHTSYSAQHSSSGHYAGYTGGAEAYQYSTPDTTPQWYTPAASSATPSYITPVARNSALSMNAGQSRDVLRAAQQATPEQARAVLQKFQSIRSRQRAQSGLAPGL